MPTARLTELSRDNLDQARAAGIKLIYFSTLSHEKTIIQQAIELRGILVDHKVTYLIDITVNHNLNNKLDYYSESQPSDQLIQLAYDSGKYSRFKNDPNLSDIQFKTIYHEWMVNSVNHTIARDILVIYAEKILLGMVTVGEKNHRGDIGLLAVAQRARGKKIGTKLVHAAQQYFYEKKYTQSQVVTQKDNIAACALYEKCGYHVEKTECFFHFWL